MPFTSFHPGTFPSVPLCLCERVFSIFGGGRGKPASCRRAAGAPYRLRRNCVKPTLAHKNFAEQAHPSKQQPYKFSEFSVLSVDKKKILIADQWKKSTAFFRIMNFYAVDTAYQQFYSVFRPELVHPAANPESVYFLAGRHGPGNCAAPTAIRRPHQFLC